ncbi:MAG: hypothetical protein AAB770_01075 [Patescibacteria group bacterium]
MDNETEKIIKEQARKLPAEVIAFLLSSNWSESLDEISSIYNFSDEERFVFKHEVVLVLTGLTYPDELLEMLVERVPTKRNTVLESVVADVEKKIFAPIRPALVDFFDREAEAYEKETRSEAPVATEAPIEKLAPTAHMWEKISGAVPENLPILESMKPLMPPIPPKTPNSEARPMAVGEVPAHPFEEKMKKVFTAGQQSTGDLVIKSEPASAPLSVVPPVPIVQNVPIAPSTYRADPYREAIE